MASPLDPFNIGQRSAAQQAEQMQQEAVRAQRAQIAFQMELNQATRHKVQLERQILELTIEARKAETEAWKATADLRKMEALNGADAWVKRAPAPIDEDLQLRPMNPDATPTADALAIRDLANDLWRAVLHGPRDMAEDAAVKLRDHMNGPPVHGDLTTEQTLCLLRQAATTIGETFTPDRRPGDPGYVP